MEQLNSLGVCYHRTHLRHAGAGTAWTADNRADTRRFYEVIGMDVMFQVRGGGALARSRTQ